MTLILSFTAKAHQSRLLRNHLSLLPLPVQATVSLTNDDISDKLAADEKFVGLINLIAETELKTSSLSLADKKLFKKYAEQKNKAELSKVYTKCGIDYNKQKKIKQ